MRTNCALCPVLRMIGMRKPPTSPNTASHWVSYTRPCIAHISSLDHHYARKRGKSHAPGIKAGYHEAFMEALLGDARGAVYDEPGCLRFDVLQDAGDPNTIYLYEVYRDE